MATRSACETVKTDTIAAVSTAWGEAGIAIVRVSGPDAAPLAKSVLRFGPMGFPPPREMRLASLLDSSGQAIDQVLAVYFAAPRSYTGEDIVEIHTHGGTLVVQTCLEMLLSHPVIPARLAAPGEFTRRAYLNGRLDLSQAEAVLGVIRARSAEALRAAARTLSGSLSSSAREIHEELLRLQGNLEVGLDFPEGEPPQVTNDDLLTSLKDMSQKLRSLEGCCSAGALLREGVRTVLCGRPNVGKSSLLNALLGQDRAIVTNQPGTTRDLIEEGAVWGDGIPVRLTDTAGLREADTGSIEASGIERARAAMEAADVCVWVLDGSRPLELNETREIPQGAIVALNKADLPHIVQEKDVQTAAPGAAKILRLSARTGEGLDALKEAVLSLVRGEGTLREGLNVTARQLSDIRNCAHAVSEAEISVREGVGEDVTAGLLAEARGALEQLLGLGGGTEALLDSIFSRFCVGK
ncbi:MAG: tRNA uridine-5-carboxymethylaminomethyl(34) synthesis GTPase MnmE [Fretibacterium sp.]|nr:tRNA uridine-5-carboxymethylaminomethyl(34) synthesis GTPase MnmE [Fretibacterium sp.]